MYQLYNFTPKVLQKMGKSAIIADFPILLKKSLFPFTST